MSLLFKPVPVAGVTVTPAGASVTYLNFTGRVGTVGTGERYAYLRTIADCILFWSYHIRAVGSTQT